jgi:H+-transporting ATPase
MRAGAELAELPLSAAMAELDSSPGELTGEQARARLERFGPNEITEKRESPVLVLLGISGGRSRG